MNSPINHNENLKYSQVNFINGEYFQNEMSIYIPYTK